MKILSLVLPLAVLCAALCAKDKSSQRAFTGVGSYHAVGTHSSREGGGEQKEPIHRLTAEEQRATRANPEVVRQPQPGSKIIWNGVPVTANVWYDRIQAMETNERAGWLGRLVTSAHLDRHSEAAFGTCTGDIATYLCGIRIPERYSGALGVSTLGST
jgi:hypothetical protein